MANAINKAPVKPTQVPGEPSAESGSLGIHQGKPSVPIGTHDLSVHGVPLLLTVSNRGGKANHKPIHTLNGMPILPTHALYLFHFANAERENPGALIPSSVLPRIAPYVTVIGALNKLHLSKLNLRIEKAPGETAYRIVKFVPTP